MTLSQMFSNAFMLNIILKALIVGTLVSLCASLLGVSLVLRRYSMIGDGLSHVGFLVTAIATVLKLSDIKLELTIPIVVLAAFLLLRLKDSGKVKGDAAIAILSTGAIAVGSLVYNFTGSRNIDICNSLFGSASIITLTDRELYISVILCSVVLLLFLFFYSKIFCITFDEPFAAATGTRTGLYTAMVSVLTAVTIVIGMEMMGAIMISGLILFPTLSAVRLCRSFKSLAITAAALSVICFLIGFLTACSCSFQTGPTVVSAHIAVFLILSAVGAAVKRVRKRPFGAEGNV